LRVNHTSAQTIGQVYVPLVNWALLASVVTLVLAFGSSASLAFAYGMAVTATITITTSLFLYLAYRQRGWPLWIVITGGGAMLAFDLLFFAANLIKLIHGAWLPLMIGLALFTVMTTWQRGRQLVSEHRQEREGSLRGFIDDLHRGAIVVRRVSGTAVFLNRGKETTPLALRANVEHNHVLHAQVVILSVETDTVPYVPDSDRMAVDFLGREDGIIHVTARVGYAESVEVPRLLELLADGDTEGRLDLRNPSYFLSTIDVSRGPTSDMATWRQQLFMATTALTTDAADSFGLPRDRTIIVGSRIAV
jgi:KUP system potassium uptake protein